MLVSQIMFTLKAIKDKPGLTLEELWDHMYKEWGHIDRVRYIVFNGNYRHLKSLIDDLTCVEERDGRYYFDKTAATYCAGDRIFDFCVRDAIEKGRL